MITESDLAWCAGFFEGEGTLVFTSGHLEFKITQVYLEPLEKFMNIMGGVRILGPYKNGRSQVPIYSMNSYLYHDIKIIYNAMLPWLSERRIEQAQKAFSSYYDYKKSLKSEKVWKAREKEAARRRMEANK